MQKIYKNKTPKVYKNKKLNNANFGTYNLNDYQVFLQLVSKLGKLDEAGTYQQSLDLERKHLLTAKEFSEAFNVDINTTYRILKTAGKKLSRTAITLEKPELFVTQEIPICSFAEYNNKEGSLTIEFNEHIMPYLAQVKKKFVLYNLKEIANFGSLYSTRLYELIQEFKDTGWILKSVVQLREIFAVGKKFSKYNDFKKYTFAHAVEEINSQYDMNLRFRELKDGRKVVSICFEFTPSQKAQGYNSATKQIVNITVKPKRKKNEDDTPLSVYPNQLELPNIGQEPTKLNTVKGKILKAIGAEPEHIEAAESGTSHLEASKKVIIRRTQKAKVIIEKSTEEVKAIITALMEEEKLSETQATIRAIKLKLI